MMTTLKDMIGGDVSLQLPARRIVSTVPSQTELLYDLGLNDEVIGITKFCVHPQAWFRSKERIGGTKNLNIEKIKSLKPDLILANKEENTKEQIEELSQFFPVWVSDINTVTDAISMMQQVGRLTGKEFQANTVAKTIEENFPDLKENNQSVAYFIWYRPWMSVGNDTFIHDVLQRCGWKNVFDDKKRYPEISQEMLRDAVPDLVLLSSDPFPFKEKHIAEVKALLPNASVKLVDGEMFSWYGSRMLKAIDYLKNFLRETS